jgi:S-adenosylmethionine/arginine decarboxylase-like enzyme
MEQVVTAQLNITGHADVFDSQDTCSLLLDAVVSHLGLTKLHTATHHFEPQGVSIIYLLSESHIALHTWPENGTGYITLSSCGDRQIEAAEMRRILERFGCNLQSLQVIGKGA